MRKVFFLVCVFLMIGIHLSAQDLSIGGDDLVLEQGAEDGFHLFIRKKADIRSVLLTESTRDPSLTEDNFAYRVPEWNPINGDEIRLLNGYPIPRENGIYSLISSTPQPHPTLGEAFHIFIPWVVYYGYSDTRNGEILMADGTYINIRAFSFPYADYRGRFADNPFVLRGVQRPSEEPREYMTVAERSFSEIAEQGKGDFVYAANPEDLIDKIEDLLVKETGKSVDIVLCIDSTGSMGRYIDSVRKMLIPMMRSIIAGFSDFRIGMVLYRDYPPDVYITKVYSFTKDFSVFQRNLNSAGAWGGSDVPEAVYEALYDGVDKFDWEAESRLLILVGDAPPHPEPRGSVSREMVFEKAKEKGIKISSILLPQ